MQDPLRDPAEVPHYHCPNCGGLIAAPMGQRLIVCRDCGEQSFISEDSSTTGESSDPHDQAELPAATEPELSEARIRQISNLRRGAYRNRSWCVVGAVSCLVGAAQLIQMIVQEARRGSVILPIGFCLAAAAALLGSGYFVRSVMVLTREIRASSLANPTSLPDFSTLSDGSQQWRRLDEISDAER